MGDFPWRPLVKQVIPSGRTVPPSAVAPIVGEGGQLAVEVCLIVGVADVTP